MKRFILSIGLIGSVVGISLTGGGCGGKDTGSGGAGGAGGATNSQSSTSSQMTGNPTSGPGGAGGMSQGHSFDNPFTIMVNDMTPAMGTLPDPVTSQDFYKFTGMAGEKIAIATTAKTGMDAFDPTYLDLVVTLYDASHNQIARQDDPWPRFSNDPQLYTFLPSAGDYFVEVQECNAVFGTMSCAPATAITNDSYTLQVFDLVSAPQDSITDGAMETAANHTDDDISTPNTLKYIKSSGNYQLSFIDSTFVDGSDVDVYAFTPPADVTVSAGSRANADFWIAPAGKNDDGATNPVGQAWITDATGTVILAQLDASLYDDEDDATNGSADLNSPVTADGMTQYFLWIKHPATAHGSNDFYVVEHFVGGGNPVETEPNDPTTPETLTMPQMNADGSNSFFIEGDVAAGDTDGFVMPTGAGTKVSAICAGLRLGSGATLSYQLNADTNTGALIGAIANELPNKDVSIAQSSIPGSATQIVLSITPTAQSATVTGSHYRCGITIAP